MGPFGSRGTTKQPAPLRGAGCLHCSGFVLGAPSRNPKSAWSRDDMRLSEVRMDSCPHVGPYEFINMAGIFSLLISAKLRVAKSVFLSISL